MRVERGWNRDVVDKDRAHPRKNKKKKKKIIETEPFGCHRFSCT
jgi:hypothetical protein